MARPPLDRDGNPYEPYPDDPWGRLYGDPEYGMPPAAAAPKPETENPGGGGGGGGGGKPPTFTPPVPSFGYPSLPSIPGAPIPDLPTFRTPPAFEYDDYTPSAPYEPGTPYGDFRAPSVEEALIDPGYTFRVGQGKDALQGWAAARGTLNDSGTAKALIDYGQNAASQEYRNVWDREHNKYSTNRDTYNLNEGNRFKAYTTNEANRYNTYATNRRGAVDAYERNYNTQYVDPYKFEYQASLDRFAPKLEQWRAGNDRADLGYVTQTGITERENNAAYERAWKKYLEDMRQWEL